MNEITNVMVKLELKHLAPYLPYRLKAEMLDYKSDYVGKQYDEIVGVHQWDKNCLYWSALTVGGSKPNIERIKPILRPLSDLNKEIEHNGEKFVPIDWFEIGDDWNESIDYGAGNVKLIGLLEDMSKHNFIDLPYMSYGVTQKLFEWHFDVFGLINKGLAVDINTL